MSTSTTAALTSVTSLASASSDGLLQSATKTFSQTTRLRTITAGDSGIPLSSSFAVNSATSISESQKYKTIYVTKTAVPDSETGSSSDLPPGAIAGIAVGGAVVLALIIGLVYFLLRRRRKKVAESLEVPSTSGSQATIVGKKSEGDISELYGTRDQPMCEANSKPVYEMDASVPELDSRTFSLESALSPTSEAAGRNIMSRGRPVRRASEKG